MKPSVLFTLLNRMLVTGECFGAKPTAVSKFSSTESERDTIHNVSCNVIVSVIVMGEEQHKNYDFGLINSVLLLLLQTVFQEYSLAVAAVHKMLVAYMGDAVPFLISCKLNTSHVFI